MLNIELFIFQRCRFGGGGEDAAITAGVRGALHRPPNQPTPGKHHLILIRTKWQKGEEV